MKTTFLFLLLVSIILSSGCKRVSPKETDLSTIDLTGNLKQEKEMFLSDIATDIEYVKLDNSISATIGQVGSFNITDHYLLVLDRMQSRILLFDRSGKFLRQISKPGKGPGEYTNIQDVSIHPNEQFVYIMSQKNINIYRISGEYIRTVTLPAFAFFVEPVDEGFIAFFPSRYSALMDNYTIVLLAQDGKIEGKLHKRNWESLRPGDPIKQCRFYFYDNQWCFNEDYYDTVYAVTPNRQIIPHICFKREKSLNDASEVTGYSLEGFKELPKHILISGSKNMILCNLVYERETGKIWHIPNDTITYQAGFTNDLDGGLPVWSGKIFKGKMFVLVDAIFLSDMYKRICELPYTAKLEKRRKEFEFLLSNLNENDNQVLTIITLK